MLRALYGHPHTGTFWETQCDKAACEVGFVPIANWPSCYVHAKLKLFLVVYVDGFKISGPQVNMARGWKLTQPRLNFGDPTPSNLYLGCTRECKQLTLNNGKRARAAVRNMEEYLNSTVAILQPCEAEHGQGPRVEKSQHALPCRGSQGRPRCSADIRRTGCDLPLVSTWLPDRGHTRWRSRHGQQCRSNEWRSRHEDNAT